MKSTLYQRTTIRPVRGFTLIELVVSLAITAILMTGLTSALLIATTAMPGGDRTADVQIRQCRAVERILSELRCAKHIVEHSDTAVAFTVGDRDGDGMPERIRYAWSGIDGEPLTREYNGQTPVTVLADVTRMALQYEYQSVAEVYPGPMVQVNDVLLSSFNPGESYDTSYIDSDWQEAGQYFQPVFPEGTCKWHVTRVRLSLAQHGMAKGSTYLQVRRAEVGGLPTDETLAELVIKESTLSSGFKWEEYTFEDVVAVEAGAALCLMLKYKSTGPTLKYEYADSGNGTTVWTSPNGEWHRSTNHAIAHQIFGAYLYQGPDQTLTRQFVTSARVTLQTGDSTTMQTDSSARLLNAPEVLSAYWELDFSTSPTSLDINGDGMADWTLRQGGEVDADGLSGDVYTANGELDTQPDHDFSTPTTIDVRFRAVREGGEAVLWSNVDFADGNFVPLIAHVKLKSDNTQTLAIHTEWPLDGLVMQVTDLPSDFVTLRMLVDPDQNTVNVCVNGMEWGTFAYLPYAPTTDPHRATITEWGNGGEFDYVRIRVGGTN